MVTIRIAKFMLGLGAGFFSRILAPLRGGSKLKFSQNSAFDTHPAKPSCELRVAWTRCWSTTWPLFESNIYHLFKSTYHVSIFEPDIPSHTTHAWYVYLDSLWFLSSPKVSWPLNTEPCYTGSFTLPLEGLMILREALNMQPAEELQLATAECSKADHWDPLSNPVTWIYRLSHQETLRILVNTDFCMVLLLSTLSTLWTFILYLYGLLWTVCLFYAIFFGCFHGLWWIVVFSQPCVSWFFFAI